MLNIQSMDSWITVSKPNPKADLRLFCFPYAGGSSIIFRCWSDKLPNNIEICPIELPGRGSKIQFTPLNRLQPIIANLSSQIQPYLDKPFAFFGHSMGGLVSFELARLLRKKYGILPSKLFISARRAPQIPSAKPPIHLLPDTEFKQELYRLNGTPVSVLQNNELMQLLIPILKADFAVLETYIYTNEPPLKCPITVFGGLQDSEVSCDDLQAWQEQTKADFNLNMVPGNHFFLHSAQSLLLENLIKYLQNIKMTFDHR